MEQAEFGRLLARVEKDCTPAQRLAVSALAEAVNAKDVVQSLLATRAAKLDETRVCPRCGKTALWRHGKDKNSGLARFDCHECGRTCTALTETPLVKIRKRHLIIPFLEATLERRGHGKTAEILEVSETTVFTWRHLNLGHLVARPKESVGGVVEADEKFFIEAHKGTKAPTPGFAARPPRHRGSGALNRGLSLEQVPVLTALDRDGHIVEGVLKKRSSAEIVALLGPNLAAQSALCSDGFSGYADTATERYCAHMVFKPKKPTPAAKAKGLARGRKGALGLGMVNSFHEVMDTGINRIFRGVSTKYLANYAALERLIRQKFDTMRLLGALLA
jgi:transposase-like protein